MEKQVFQTQSKARWRHFKWGMRIVLAIIVLLVMVFMAMALLENAPGKPFLHDYRKAVTAEKPLLKNNKMADEYKAIRNKIATKQMHNNYEAHDKQKRFKGKTNDIQQKYEDEWYDERIGVRAAWSVNWDKKSYQSLKTHLRKLNMVMPEWLFINPKTLKLETKIDTKTQELLRRSGVPVMPMLTNNYAGTFRSDAIGRIMKSEQLTNILIDDLVRTARQHHFAGINIDLEDLKINDNAILTNFIKKLAQALHKDGRYLTQDIQAFNDDYDTKELAKHADFLFLMAYDEHNATGKPGPISSAEWVEKAIDHATRNIPNDKIVLGLASYGYDWDGEEAQTLDFQQNIANAYDAGVKPIFDTDTYNTSYDYQDNEGALHHVEYVDAATTFNLMRLGAEYPLAGYALWRLGTEDRRLWRFYDKNMSLHAAAQMDVKALMKIRGTGEVNYVGDGEVLQVESEPVAGKIKVTRNRDAQIISNEVYEQLPATWVVNKLGHANGKELVLTFDDGPDSKWTPKVLDVLKEKNVPAAFFMVGLQMEKNLPLVKRVYNEGHIIGNHTFTHLNMVENTDNRSYTELKLTRMLIECVTGHSTILFRAPYNADADPSDREEIEPMILASRRNYLFVGESIDPNDWEPHITTHEIVRRVMAGVHNGNGHIILLHDAGGTTRQATIEALPIIIDRLKAEGYRFISLNQYMKMKRDTMMPPIPKGKTYYAMQLNLTLAEMIYATIDFLVALFLVFMVLGFMRLLFMMYLTTKEKRMEKRRQYGEVTRQNAPKVSIIVPAYNEEVNIVRTITNLLKQDYPNFDIVFVDDGSKDMTLQRVKEQFDNHPTVRIHTHPNGGKASALNYGIAHTDAPYIICIDADTQLKTNAVSMLMRHFIFQATNCTDKRNRLPLGAVAGNVKVGNRRNLLTKWQDIEYTTSQNFDRMAYSAINAITVVPGAIGAFSRKAVLEAGGFTTDTLAEDCDLTMRIVEAGYVIENENSAVAMTEAPEKLKQFVKQRQRWCFGVMQTFWKHRQKLFTKKIPGYGWWALPNMLVFQYIIPTFSPLADIMMIVGLISGNGWQILLYYIMFLAVDCSVSLMAYLVEKEKLSVLVWIIPQRFFYRWIMYYVIFKSYLKAIKGELQQWGVLKRTGNVTDICQ